jgi:hypothetical protein
MLFALLNRAPSSCTVQATPIVHSTPEKFCEPKTNMLVNGITPAKAKKPISLDHIASRTGAALQQSVYRS